LLPHEASCADAGDDTTASAAANDIAPQRTGGRIAVEMRFIVIAIDVMRRSIFIKIFSRGEVSS
jgi:hypothetical protein